MTASNKIMGNKPEPLPWNKKKLIMMKEKLLPKKQCWGKQKNWAHNFLYFLVAKLERKNPHLERVAGFLTPSPSSRSDQCPGLEFELCPLAFLTILLNDFTLEMKPSTSYLAVVLDFLRMA